jgi:hypothetical protein
MDNEKLKNKLVQSLKEFLDWYKCETSADKMDFGIIHAVCEWISDLDPQIQAERRWEELKNTIIVNPEGRVGDVLFFVDPRDL